MSPNYANLSGMVRTSRRRTSQTQPISGREPEMVQNDAGGYGFRLDAMAQLNRFLIIGCTGSSYYVGQTDMIEQNVAVVRAVLNNHPQAVLDRTIEVLENNLAFKPEPALFVLSMCAAFKVNEADELAQGIRRQALAVVPKVCRTATHLYHFIDYCQKQRGWGRGLRTAVAAWYNQNVNKMAQQAWKYKQRDGWSHRDLLRLAHPKTSDFVRNRLFTYMTHPDRFTSNVEVPDWKSTALVQIEAAEKLLHLTESNAKTVKRACRLITDHKLTHEVVPNHLKGTAAIWAALLPSMPLIAIVRNLNKMTAVGLIGGLSDAECTIADRLTNSTYIRETGAHPLQFLLAQRTYAQGRGERGSLTWRPSGRIVEALEEAFYLAFQNVEPTNKRILLACDHSGSMQSGNVAGLTGFVPVEAAAAMMLATFAIEPNCLTIGFGQTVRDFSLTRRMSIAEVLLRFAGLGEGTNTALPLHHCLECRLDVDAVISYTDSNGWGAGYRSGHVTEVHRQYENQVGHTVKFVNCSIMANSASDVDPDNSSMFELAGLSADTPRMIAEFINGRF